jgi:hypothetical protein
MSEGIFPVARGAPGPNDPSQYDSGSALVGTAGVVIKASQGKLYKIAAVNNAATPYILMVFDKATAPVNNDVPIWRRRLPASGEIEVDFGLFGIGGTAGLSWAISSTVARLTLAVSADVSVSAIYK